MDLVDSTFLFILNEYVIPNLEYPDLAICREVSKEWNELALKEITKRVEKKVFAKEAWEALGIDFTNKSIPPLPIGIFKWLNSPCDFNPAKTRLQTGSLVLEFEGLSIIGLGKLMRDKYPKELNYSGYKSSSNTIIKAHGNSSLAEFRWIWITDNLINDIIGDNSIYQAAGAIDVITNCYLHYVKNDEERLLKIDNCYTDERIWARCRETVLSGKNVMVGLFSPLKEKYGKGDFVGGGGLSITIFDSGDSSFEIYGTIAMRMFKS
jgi:hypothetical protein